MWRRRAMGMGVVVAGVVVMAVVVGVVVRHKTMLHYNITGVHALTRLGRAFSNAPARL